MLPASTKHTVTPWSGSAWSSDTDAPSAGPAFDAAAAVATTTTTRRLSDGSSVPVSVPTITRPSPTLYCETHHFPLYAEGNALTSTMASGFNSDVSVRRQVAFSEPSDSLGLASTRACFSVRRPTF